MGLYQSDWLEALEHSMNKAARAFAWLWSYYNSNGMNDALDQLKKIKDEYIEFKDKTKDVYGSPYYEGRTPIGAPRDYDIKVAIKHFKVPSHICSTLIEKAEEYQAKEKSQARQTEKNAKAARIQDINDGMRKL